MGSSADWASSLISAAVPEEIVKKVSSSYCSLQVFAHSFDEKAHLDIYARALLIESKLASAYDANGCWKFTQCSARCVHYG